MPITLVEAAKMETTDIYRAGVIEQFARESEILRTLPFQEIAGNALRYNREEALPGIAFRGVNEGYSESSGIINPMTESLYIAGGDLDVDRFIVNTQGDEVRSAHEALKIKALSAEWTNKFIKGDTTANVREFDGLQVRITGSQLIANGATSGGDPLSLVKLDEAIDQVGNASHLLMSRAMRRRFAAAARNPNVSGYITYSLDEFGRRVTNYNDIPILTTYQNAKMPDPLDFVESAPGGGSTASSIYVLSLGENGVVGIQNGGIDVRDLGELDTMPLFRTRVEWYSGFAIFDGYSAARLWGISNAAIVA